MAKTVKGAMRFGDNLLDVLRGFIRMFEKGVDEVVAFFKKIIDDFFDWLEDMFKKGKADEVLDSVKKVGSGGFLKFKKIISRNMVKQEELNSCVPACIKQLAKDNGIEMSEESIRILAKTTNEGTNAPNTAKALIEIFSETKQLEMKMLYESGISDINAIKSISNDGAWITFIRPNATTKPHAIIVDRITGNKVYVRDPWPLEAINESSFYSATNGVVAEASLEEFVKQWAFGGNYIFKIKK